MNAWMQIPKNAKLLRTFCITGWLLCLVSAATFVGASVEKKLGIEVVLYAGVFPFFFG